jgi:D-glutamate cyclase
VTQARNLKMSLSPIELVCKELELIISNDVGRRGIEKIALPNQLLPSSKSFIAASGIIILTGFPCLLSFNPPTETDGPPGAAALAHAAVKLGKETAIATDDCNAAVVLDLSKKLRLQEKPNFRFLSFGPDVTRSELESLAKEYDHAIAIERAGRAVDGGYYTMRAYSMNHLVSPLDDLLTIGCAASFDVAGTHPTRTSTGIGDGGNECGMGKVLKSVQEFIPNGKVIACDVASDNLITAGVSNWGGYALVACVEAFCRAYQEDLNDPLNSKIMDAKRVIEANEVGWLLPSPQDEILVTDSMIISGARDGISGKNDGSVDGLHASVHMEVVESMRKVLRTAFE